MPKPDAILIAGPTAGGKSALAVALAERVAGVVINADSMQVYRDLSVLTARPTAAEMAGVRHELYGFVGASDPYSVGRYSADAAVLIEAVRARGQMPIITGGTGLYFRALLEGLSPVPPIDPEVRRRWREAAENHGAPHLLAALRVRDPAVAARLMPTDTQRLVRALEVIESTGRSLSFWQSIPGTPILRAENCLKVAAIPDRPRLYQRCDQRFLQMLETGALFEVSRLQAMQLDPSLPIMGALGVGPLLAYLGGDCDLGAATERAQQETRRYAKRQLTWLRRNMITWKHINTTEMEINDAMNIILG